ncbi:hypothetical protein [Geitlerinema sp. PCC 9228]|jgi:hypothetical protein|uniref:hypothetical protein n=1 Tax=Geitlerinema sp. PCC 9228 TaxID=111611 RepID=UPI001114C7A8|nr:hypothetical protein [Geitlerinema sp. PCC 9228]
MRRTVMQRKFLFLVSFLLGLLVFLGTNLGIRTAAQFPGLPDIPGGSRNLPGWENLLSREPAATS